MQWVVLGVHVDVGYVVGGCNVQCSCYTEHGRCALSCLYAETVESMSMVYMVYGLYDVLGV